MKKQHRAAALLTAVCLVFALLPGCAAGKKEDAAEELHRMEEAEAARREQEKIAGKASATQKMFKAV